MSMDVPTMTCHTNEMEVGHALRLTGRPLGLCAKGIFKFDSAIHKAD